MGDPEDLDRFFPLAQEKAVGVIAMKVVERGALIKKGLDIRAKSGHPPEDDPLADQFVIPINRNLELAFVSLE